MAKRYSYYANDVDHCWYDSSNIVYTECIDHENELKTLKVVFSNGTQYQYNKVNVGDYLLLRESQSQGKALNRLIKEKKYEYVKLENANLEELNDELMFRSGSGFFIKNDENGFEIKNNTDEIVFKIENPIDNGVYDMVKDILKSVNVTFKEQ